MSTYQSDRPTIPANTRREVEVEAGHKCSITTCHEHTYLEIHHINQNRADNRKENLILLCDKHHKMAHANIIDTKALYSHKEKLRSHSSNNNFIRAQEGDRIHQFLESIENLFSYIDCGKVGWVSSETGYRFEQAVYIKLIEFFDNIHIYNMELRSYDQSAKNRQDQVVYLLQQLLNIRSQGNYIYHNGYCAKFIPKHSPGTPEYDREISMQKKTVEDILLEIQNLMSELWEYVENRSM